MKITKYNNLTHKELEEVEKKLTKKIGFKEVIPSNFRKKYGPGADSINNLWKHSYFWAIPDIFIESYIEGKFKGEYQISTHILLNEDFSEFINEKCNKKVKRLINRHSKRELKKASFELDKSIVRLTMDFRNSSINDLKDLLIDQIKKNSVKVNKYEPHLLGSEEGDKSFILNELIGDMQFVYRGIIKGNIYAYEKLIAKYANEDLINNLWENTCEILDKSKEHLAIQMAIEHKTYSGEPILTEDEKLWFKSILKMAKKFTTDDQIKEMLKKEVPKFRPDPNASYFWGDSFKKKQFGIAFEQIYNLKFGKKFGSAAFRKHNMMDILD